MFFFFFFFSNQAFFVSTPSGWITKKMFIAFAVFFCNEISLYRIENNISEDIWLILDGHRSRKNSIAIEYLNKNKVNVLILPSHCSHVCQPFDVGLASPMKRRIKDFSQSPTELITEMINSLPTQAARARVLIIYSITNAYHQTMTSSNCSSSFFATGIIPFNIQKVLSNKFVRMTEPND